MNKQIYSCGHAPSFLISYTVAGEEKFYEICNLCSKLECFQKFIVKKVSI